MRPGDLVALEGDLGTGKTVLVQGIAEGLGVRTPVHSPTFTLRHRYPGRVPLEHVDLYRLEASSWVDSGLDEVSPDAVTVVEWSDRASVLDAWSTVRIHLEAGAGDGEGRVLRCVKGPARVRAVFHDAMSGG